LLPPRVVIGPESRSSDDLPKHDLQFRAGPATIQARRTDMTKTYCDFCGDVVGVHHATARIPAPFDHPEYGAPFVQTVDLCPFCAGGLVEAYATKDSEAVTGLWLKIAERAGWDLTTAGYV
jgi:hypothetical protein